MSKPLVSIVMPVYNRAALIQATLETIRVQTYTHWECILIDDGSTDTTAVIINNIVAQDPRFQYYNRPDTIVKGANGCRNYGFTLAQGEFINWFDSDDVMKPDFIAKKLAAFAGDTEAVLHRNDYANYQLTRYRTSKFVYKHTQSLFYNYAMDAIEIQTCGFMWRKVYLEDKALFNDTIERYQDNEFHIRMLALRPNVVIIDHVLATIRGGDGAVDQISSRANVSKKKLYDIFYFRYQTLKLAEHQNVIKKNELIQHVAKKMLWAFYTALQCESNRMERFKDLRKYYSKLNIVYLNKDIGFITKFKSHIYLFKILIFR
ncbi:glycosyltransferase family 2 protein [Lacinutrix neustonica]|uniref:Glycosyltransferase family 2 protein n=1 Tax=Lacinutrix neustonica TaxID=2980107 RepID=A0A9E8SGP6_9FLAO|nr:glycosyltransferase family 2 protein [Lacinutrix neustonica]WAC01940.1 glycosyltransferase family 2 protein [Lacinutrix neustonica]